MVQLILAPPRGGFHVAVLRCEWRGFSFRLLKRLVPGDLHYGGLVLASVDFQLMRKMLKLSPCENVEEFSEKTVKMSKYSVFQLRKFYKFVEMLKNELQIQ